MSVKHILFITNNFPPITCGVGDYTYKLAKALTQQSIRVSVLCAAKPEIVNSKAHFKKEGIDVFPLVKSWDKKGLSSLSDQFQNIDAEWVSLQYVPFSFHPKGVPLGLTKGLKLLFPKIKWEIMFHELWVGKVANATFRLKLHGYIQKFLIINMLKVLKPKVVHTHSEIYLFQLEKIGITSKKLTLFSNIDKNESFSIKKLDSNDVVFSIFGGIINGAPVVDFIEELNVLLHLEEGKKLKFNFLGNNGPNLNVWTRALRDLDISFEVHGFLSESKISEVLLQSDFGITTTPYLLTEKSGAVAAMKQHGLRILCVSRFWDLPLFDKSQINDNIIKEYKKGKLRSMLLREWNTSDYKDVNTVGTQLLKDLNF